MKRSSKYDNIDHDDVREYLNYNADTGEMTWAMSTVRNGYVPVGTPALANICPARLTGNFLGTRHVLQTHAIWFLVHGVWPTIIDHINGDGLDNRLDNLRNVSSAENNKNKRRNRTNTSGVTGVHYNKPRGKWMADIQVDGWIKRLGQFARLEDAAAARKQAEIDYGFHENHGRSK